MTSSTAVELTIRQFSLKDAPALIERMWPAQKISAEAQKERKAVAGLTLTALGSYWKGRKPLVLVRACVLGALLPATADSERDLEIFEKLMAIDDEAFAHRARKSGAYPAILEKPYLERIEKDCLRPEKLPDGAYESIWPDVNAHLGTYAHSFPELVEQLGIMRFGHRPGNRARPGGQPRQGVPLLPGDSLLANGLDGTNGAGLGHKQDQLNRRQARTDPREQAI